MATKGPKDINGRAMAAVDDMGDRGAAYLSDVSAQGQRLAQEVDGRLEEYTGKSSEAWMREASKMIKKHPWKAIALAAVVAYLFAKVGD